MSFEKMMDAVTEILKHKDFYQDPVSRLREAYKKGFNDCHLDQFDGFKRDLQELAALRAWKEAATPYLEDLLDNEYLHLDTCIGELERAKRGEPSKWAFDEACKKKQIERFKSEIEEQEKVCEKLHKLLPDYDMVRSAK